MYKSMNDSNHYEYNTAMPAMPTPPTTPQVSEDYGPYPFVVDIDKAAMGNNNYRTALWTGYHLQVTLMTLQVGEDIGLELHPDVDQLLIIVQGKGVVQMGQSRDMLSIQQPVYENCAMFVPAGEWHNVTNTGMKPLKLFTAYAPPNHPWGTVEATKAIAEANENQQH